LVLIEEKEENYNVIIEKMDDFHLETSGK